MLLRATDNHPRGSARQQGLIPRLQASVSNNACRTQIVYFKRGMTGLGMAPVLAYAR